ncbi:MAG: cupin domain-containing protein [Gammaproteobacteria bacterium]
MSGKSPLGGLTARAFLKRYWQKSPCLIRRAFPEFTPPISPDELAGLACETEVESRLVIRTHQRPGWSVHHGPFTKRDFHSLPEKNWTLLVQDTDKHLPVLAEFLAYFSFIPNWRIDDLMISYAADGGSVGPHVDAYDVFLLQAQGRRRWHISRKTHKPARIPGLELKQVRAFKAQQSWVLKPGDMLYLPPGVAHHGVALGECMTFSIGFRAPSDAEMIADLSGALIERLNKDVRYADPGLSPANADPGLITNMTRAAIRRRIQRAQNLSAEETDEWFGRFITESKPRLEPVPSRRKLTPARLRKRLAACGKLQRDPAAILAWYGAGSGKVKLFANGRCHVLPAHLSNLARWLCRVRSYPAAQLEPWLLNRDTARLLTALYNAGVLYAS